MSKKYYILLQHHPEDATELLNVDIRITSLWYDHLKRIESNVVDCEKDINEIKGELICLFQRFLWAIKIVKLLDKTNTPHAIDAVLDKMHQTDHVTYVLNPGTEDDGLFGRTSVLSRISVTDNKKHNPISVPMTITADVEALYKADELEDYIKAFTITHDPKFFTNDQETIDEVIKFCIDTAEGIVTLMSFYYNSSNGDDEVNESIADLCKKIRDFNFLGKTEKQISDFMDDQFKIGCKGFMKSRGGMNGGFIY